MFGPSDHIADCSGNTSSAYIQLSLLHPLTCGWWQGIADPFEVALLGTLKVLLRGPFALPLLPHGDVVKVGSGVKGLGKQPGIIKVAALGDSL